MPTTFYDRERAFEAKFAHDEEFRFRVLARRDKLFAGWTAAKLGMSVEEADALVRSVLGVPDGPGHDQALLQSISDLLSARDQQLGPHLPEVLERCMQEARVQLIEQPHANTEPL